VSVAPDLGTCATYHTTLGCPLPGGGRLFRKLASNPTPQYTKRRRDHAPGIATNNTNVATR